MNFFSSLFLFICLTGSSPTDDTIIETNDKFNCDSVLRPYVFLSGIAADPAGCLVCDYKGNRIIRITDRGEVETVVDRVEAPVDVEYVGDSLWILCNSPQKFLLSWNPVTGERKILFSDFDSDSNLTAFTAPSPQEAYVVDFNGCVYRLDPIQQTKTIVFDGLDNPADIAILPQGDIAVTEQIGTDRQGGRLRFFLRDGSEKSIALIDPTGLAVGSDGSLYVSVFAIQQVPSPISSPDRPVDDISKVRGGGIFRISSPTSDPELIVQGFTGLTSLTVLPNNDIVAIDESMNAILRLSAGGRIQTLFQGTIYPLATRSFPDGTIVFLIDRQQRYEVVMVHKDNSNATVWSTSDQNKSLPLIEIGGDSLLYLFDPYFQEILIFDSNGTFVNSFLAFVQPNLQIQMFVDPTGGIVLVVWNREYVVIRKVDRKQIGDPVRYSGYYAYGIYIDSNGNVHDIGKENTIPPGIETGGQVATNRNGALWLADFENGVIYILNNNQLELVAGGLGAIQDISSDGNTGVNVTTQDGRIYHLTPRTPVLNWNLF